MLSRQYTSHPTSTSCICQEVAWGTVSHIVPGLFSILLACSLVRILDCSRGEHECPYHLMSLGDNAEYPDIHSSLSVAPSAHSYRSWLAAIMMIHPDILTIYNLPDTNEREWWVGQFQDNLLPLAHFQPPLLAHMCPVMAGKSMPALRMRPFPPPFCLSTLPSP